MEDPKKPSSVPNAEGSHAHSGPSADGPHHGDKAGTAPASRSPPHSAGEGVHSSASSTTPGTTPHAPQAMPTTSAGTAKAKAGAALKKRRTSQSAGPTMGPRTALVEPKEMQASDGWDDVNNALFKE